MSDLRQRRRQATEAEIEAAAIDLFARKGYEHTTVDDVAAAAGISPRTFFRHVASKEEAVFGGAREFDARLDERLREIPSWPVGLPTVEDAVAGVLTELASEAWLDRMLRVRRLILDDAALRRVAQHRDAEQGFRMVQQIIEAAGTEQERLRVRTVAEAAGAALRVALDEWALRREAGQAPDIVAVYRESCASLREVTATPR